MWERNKNSAASSESDPARRYMEEIRSQIRYKRAWPYIEKELEDHIEDQKRNLMNKGSDETEALRKAVLEMGDAITIGQELDRVHRPKPEWGIIIVMCVMLFVGALSQYYLSYRAVSGGWAGQEAFFRYLTALPFGIAVLLVIYFTDYTILGKYPKQIYAGILLLCAVFYLYTGNFVLNRLVNTGIMVYFSLLLLPAYGGLLYSYRNCGYGGILKSGAAAVLALIVFGYSQRGFVLAIFALGGLILISAAIVRGWFDVEKKKGLALVYIPTLLCVFGGFFIKLLRYGNNKEDFFQSIKGMMLMNQDTAVGFWGLYARYIVKNARFIGQGETGMAGTKGLEGFLPSWWADFSLTYLIYRLGLVAAVIAIALFVFLLVKMLRTVLKQKNILGFMVSLSVVVAIGMQCVLFFTANFGICILGILPLPLMTMGQTSLIINMALIGLLLSAHRNTDIFVRYQETEKKAKNNRRVKNIS